MVIDLDKEIKNTEQEIEQFEINCHRSEEDYWELNHGRTYPKLKGRLAGIILGKQYAEQETKKIIDLFEKELLQLCKEFDVHDFVIDNNDLELVIKNVKSQIQKETAQ